MTVVSTYNDMQSIFTQAVKGRPNRLNQAFLIADPQLIDNPGKAEVFGFVKAFIFLNWEHCPTSFARMPETISKKDSRAIRIYFEEKLIIERLLASDFSKNTSLYEKIVRAAWSLSNNYSYDFELIARNMMGRVRHAMENNSVVVPHNPKLNEEIRFLKSEALFVDAIHKKLQIANMSLIPYELVYQKLRKAGYDRWTIEHNFWWYFNVGYDNLFDKSSLIQPPVNKDVLNETVYEITLKLANISGDNNEVVDFYNKKLNRKTAFCKNCHRLSLTSDFGRELGNKFKKNYCSCDYMGELFTKRSFDEAATIDNRFTSHAELNNIDLNAVLFDAFNMKDDVSEFEDPNIVKARLIKHADPHRVIEFMPLDLQDSHKAQQIRYVKQLINTYVSYYEEYIKEDNRLPLSALVEKASQASAEARVGNEKSALIYGRLSAIHFFNEKPSRVARWESLNVERLKNNAERVDAMIIGALNSIAKL